ncbi:DNA-3-methyladenine glycosylase family protein [Paenibacillus ihumii]|uniref:DNA-3-methyladenine glycosylase family protein n=1 Tax=Paenibacillus ihumii TaxID=687436 RepID=UPI000B2AE523|nr:DNA-3-methyladenine glycosylase [Paenibacillus ihumii]
MMNPISFHLKTDDPRLAALSAADARMGALIALIGEIQTAPQGPHFASLARSIISQQISVKAAATIRGRVLELAGELTPSALSAVNDEALRGAGLSASKLAYLRDLSGKVLSGEVVLERLHEMGNAEVIQVLTSIKGIGKWTAEMFLIFGLGREDVVSVGDAGLQRSAKWLYQLEERADRKYLQQVMGSWSPYGSIASLYLWEAINAGHVDSGHTLDQLLDPLLYKQQH